MVPNEVLRLVALQEWSVNCSPPDHPPGNAGGQGKIGESLPSSVQG
jgi:hypothetical protein